MKTYYDYGTVTTLNDGDYIPVAPATPGTYKKILWSSIKSLIYSIVYPVGSYYVQYPNEASSTLTTAFPSAQSPATLFGGTWTLMYSTEGIVFQTEGYDGAGRTNGLMEDQFQGHDTTIPLSGYSGNADAYGHRKTTRISMGESLNENLTGNYDPSVRGRTAPAENGTDGTPRTGTRTAHRNRLFRVYRRDA